MTYGQLYDQAHDDQAHDDLASDLEHAFWADADRTRSVRRSATSRAGRANPSARALRRVAHRNPAAVRLAAMIAVGVVLIVLVASVRALAADGASPTPVPMTPVVTPIPSGSTADFAPGASPVGASPVAQLEVAAASQPAAATLSMRAASTRSAPARTVACGSRYVVQAGDAWITIARRAGVATRDLLAANGASLRTVLHPDQRICLPPGAVVRTAVSPSPSTTVPAAPSTTTPKPSSTTVPTPSSTTVPARTYSAAEVEQIIRAVWPDQLEDRAIAIAMRESNLKPTARNWCCSGLFQIYWSVHQRWLGTVGVTAQSQLLDPLVNANAAYQLYLRAGGWGPWGG